MFIELLQWRAFEPPPLWKRKVRQDGHDDMNMLSNMVNAVGFSETSGVGVKIVSNISWTSKPDRVQTKKYNKYKFSFNKTPHDTFNTIKEKSPIKTAFLLGEFRWIHFSIFRCFQPCEKHLSARNRDCSGQHSVVSEEKICEDHNSFEIHPVWDLWHVDSDSLRAQSLRISWLETYGKVTKTVDLSTQVFFFHLGNISWNVPPSWNLRKKMDSLHHHDTSSKSLERCFCATHFLAAWHFGHLGFRVKVFGLGQTKSDMTSFLACQHVNGSWCLNH